MYIYLYIPSHFNYLKNRIKLTTTTNSDNVTKYCTNYRHLNSQGCAIRPHCIFEFWPYFWYLLLVMLANVFIWTSLNSMGLRFVHLCGNSKLGKFYHIIIIIILPRGP